ncbi:MAG: 16S rRNA (adenine(1518)-N(6)/adenine(1519)-N(6))-dimethyltransferase RsmA [Bacillota bacterium]
MGTQKSKGIYIALMDDKTYGQVMREHGVKLKKRFGQHFMLDPVLLANVASIMVPDHSWVALEAGAGLGTLTKELCERAAWVYAVEIDTDLREAVAEVTASLTNLTWIWGDILALDLSGRTLRESHPESPLVLCGNLPYYVTSEVLYSALIPRSEWQKIAFVVQEEVGMRMAQPPGSRDFSRLSLWCQYRGKVTIERKIPKGAFVPAPEVDSCLVSIEIFDDFPLTEEEELVLDEISKRAFSQRRKTLLNTLSPVVGTKEKLLSISEISSIDLSKRPENLSIEDYVVLAKGLLPYSLST